MKEVRMMMIPYELHRPQSAAGEAELLIFGDIREGAWLNDGDASPISIAKELRELNASALTVRIDSYGGDTSAGIAIYNLLKSLSIPVTTIAEGFACSSASLIFMAGERRQMRRSSLLMIHNAWTCTMGNADELRKAADDLEKISSTAARIYVDNCLLTEGEIQSLLDDETWITPEEAIEYGFATEICEDEADNGFSHSSAYGAIRNAVLAHKQPEPAPDITAKDGVAFGAVLADGIQAGLAEPDTELVELLSAAIVSKLDSNADALADKVAEKLEAIRMAQPAPDPEKTPFQRFFDDFK